MVQPAAPSRSTIDVLLLLAGRDVTRITSHGAAKLDRVRRRSRPDPALAVRPSRGGRAAVGA